MVCCCCHRGAPAPVTDATLARVGADKGVEGAVLTVSVLKGKDEAEAVRTASSSWLGSTAGEANQPGEPLFAGWVFGDDPAAEPPTAAGKQVHLDYFHRFSFLQGQNFGGVILGAKVDGILAGVAVAYPPGKMIPPGSCDEMCMFCHLCCCKMSCATPPDDPKILGPVFKPRFEAAQAALKSKEIAQLWEPLNKRYWKLEILGVDPSSRGQSVGTSLVSAINKLADADGVPTYVEFAGEELLAYYAKLGFVDGAAEHEIAHEGGSTIKLYARLRNGHLGAAHGKPASNQVAPMPSLDMDR